MATVWIIDGYNFIRTSQRFAGWEAEAPQTGRQAALEWLGEFAQLTGESLWVVLDAYSRLENHRGEKHFLGLKVMESRGAYTADEEIVELAQERGEGAIVVSSDRQVLAGAIKAGASVLTSQEFEREVSRILRAQEVEEDFRKSRSPKGKGMAFRPPKEKQKAYQRLKRFQ